MKFYYKTDLFDGSVVAMITSGHESDELTDLAEKRESLLELVDNGCPLGCTFTNSDCPVDIVRKLTGIQKMHYIESLSEEQISSIYNYHADCCGFFSFYLQEGNDRLVGIAKH